MRWTGRVIGKRCRREDRDCLLGVLLMTDVGGNVHALEVVLETRGAELATHASWLTRDVVNVILLLTATIG